MSIPPFASRLPLLLAAAVALVSGVAIGLARLGVGLPAMAPYAALHGVLMIAAFFGTVIGIERAVAVGGAWPLAAPAGAATGGLVLLAGGSVAVAQALFVTGAAAFLAVGVAVMRRQAALHTATLALGALALLVGHLAWLLAGDAAVALPWWLAFLALTIAGERLELTRVLPPAPGARATFGVVLVAVIAGCVLAHPVVAGLWAPLGLALVALASWLVRYDIARRTVRQAGLTRYIGACLLVGYAWLALGGLLAAVGGLDPGTPLRDAALHAVTLGFVVSMVFGHAPIIVPALTGARVAWSGLFYLPLLVLHGSLAWRMVAHVLADPAMVRSAGLGNALAIALFAAVMVRALIGGARRAVPIPPG